MNKPVVRFKKVELVRAPFGGAFVTAIDHPRFPGERELVTSRVLHIVQDPLKDEIIGFETQNTIYRKEGA